MCFHRFFFEKKTPSHVLARAGDPFFWIFFPNLKEKKQLDDGSVARLFKGKNPGVSETIN